MAKNQSADIVRLMTKGEKPDSKAKTAARPLHPPAWMQRSGGKPAAMAAASPPHGGSDFEEPDDSPVKKLSAKRPKHPAFAGGDTDDEIAAGSGTETDIGSVDSDNGAGSGEDLDSDADDFPEHDGGAPQWEDDDEPRSPLDNSGDEHDTSLKRKKSHQDDSMHSSKKKPTMSSGQQERSRSSSTTTKLRQAVLSHIAQALPKTLTVSLDGQSFSAFSDVLKSLVPTHIYHLVSKEIGKFRVRLMVATGQPRLYTHGFVRRGDTLYAPQFSFSDTGDSGVLFVIKRAFCTAKMALDKIVDLKADTLAAIKEHMRVMPTKGDSWFSANRDVAGSRRRPRVEDDDARGSEAVPTDSSSPARRSSYRIKLSKPEIDFLRLAAATLSSIVANIAGNDD